MNANTIKNTVTKYWLYIVLALLAILLAITTVWGFSERNQANKFRQASGISNHANMTAEAAFEEHGITPLSSDQASNSQTTADELAYLLEEEKLSHDVYRAMYDKWGSRVFGNIKDSETMHQKMVLAIMESRNLPDPRKSEPGKFTNQDLQAFYDDLISQGNQSQQSAFESGVRVEETDIADLKKALANLPEKDTDIKDVLDNLIHSSENHLRAFSRQAGR